MGLDKMKQAQGRARNEEKERILGLIDEFEINHTSPARVLKELKSKINGENEKILDIKMDGCIWDKNVANPKRKLKIQG